MENRATIVIIGVVVAIVLTGALLVPSVSMLTDTTTKSFENPVLNPNSKMAKVVDPIEFSLNGGSFSIDGEEYSTNWHGNVLISDSMFLSLGGASATLVYGLNGQKNSIAGITAFTLGIADGIIELTYTATGTATIEMPYQWAFVFNVEGDYVNVGGATASVYINSLGDLYGVSYAGSNYVGFHDDNILIGGVVSESAKVISSPTAVSGIGNVQQLTFTRDPVSGLYVEDNGTTYAAYTVVVPSSIIGVKDAFVNMESLAMAIPILVIVMILAASISTLFRKF